MDSEKPNLLNYAKPETPSRLAAWRALFWGHIIASYAVATLAAITTAVIDNFERGTVLVSTVLLAPLIVPATLFFLLAAIIQDGELPPLPFLLMAVGYFGLFAISYYWLRRDKARNK